MAIPFHGSDALTIGVEIELQLIDPESRRLIPISDKVLERCRQKGIERVKAEIHRSMLEIETDVFKTAGECEEGLASSLRQLTPLVQELGAELSISGTHPLHHWSESQLYPKERFRAITEKFQWLARRVTVYGMHVHVAVPDGDSLVRVINNTLPYLPHLLALSTSSPYWQEVDTGLESSRIGIMDSFPYAGVPEVHRNWKELSEFYEKLIEAKTIDSPKDIYWHVRPNIEFGTVEFRICDMMPTLAEAAAVAAFIHNLVAWALEAPEKSMEEYRDVQFFLPDNNWVACRDGVDGMVVSNGRSEGRLKIRDEIERLFEMLQPYAARLNNQEPFSYVRQMLKQGSSARRQRAVFRSRGSLQAVVDSLVSELQNSLAKGREAPLQDRR